MSWIPVHNTLLHSPKLSRLTRQLEINRLTCIGHLVTLWLWAMQQAPGGSLKEFTQDEIADAAQWTGDPARFVEALIACRWMDPNKRLHNWEQHGGKLFRVRYLGTVRQRRFRQNNSRARNASGNATVTKTEELPAPLGNALGGVVSHQSNALDKSRGDKRRVEKKKDSKGVLHSTVVETEPPPDPAHPPDSEPGSRGNGCEWPTRQEWEAAAGMEGLSAAQIATEWAYQERMVPSKRWHGIDRSKLRHHAAWVRQKIVLQGPYAAAAKPRTGAERAFAGEVRTGITLKAKKLD